MYLGNRDKALEINCFETDEGHQAFSKNTHYERIKSHPFKWWKTYILLYPERLDPTKASGYETTVTKHFHFSRTHHKFRRISLVSPHHSLTYKQVKMAVGGNARMRVSSIPSQEKQNQYRYPLSKRPPITRAVSNPRVAQC